MKTNLAAFGEKLKTLRIAKGITLREMARLMDCDPSNLSKMERGKIPPPSDEKTLRVWAKMLGIAAKPSQLREFIDVAQIAQGIIPADMLMGNGINYLPAFFRTVRNKKPSRQEINRLIKLIKNA